MTMAGPVPGQGKTALITGASSGIGYELAQLFAKDGFDLVLTGRQADKLLYLAGALKEKHGINTCVLVKDLARPETPQEISTELAQRGITVDLLVNNAGFGLRGAVAETPAADELQMIQVNLTALTHLTKLFLPGMVSRGSGRILNVASTAAFQPGPFAAVYYATKAYVLSFSGALVNELQGTGVSVTALCPGPTLTGFQTRAGMERSRLFRGPVMTAEQVARLGYEGLMRGRALVIPGLRNKLLAFAVRLLPRDIVTAAVRRIQEPAR